MSKEYQRRQNKKENQNGNQPPFLLLAQEPEGFFANLTHNLLYLTEEASGKPFRRYDQAKPKTT